MIWMIVLVNLDTFEKFNLSLTKEKRDILFDEAKESSESLRGFLFLSHKGMCAVENSL